ncbi:MAG: cation:proton antiporter [Verrucomicrobiales bacterium]|nr:cation:proton antiporter [Verrucomicrobiales bacterium]
MTDQNFLHTLGLIVIAAAVFAVVASRLKLPTIVAYLAAGLTLGPLTGLVPGSAAVHTIAESGIVLLLFLVGLELNIDRIRAVGRTAVIAGLGQITATAIAAIGAGKLIGLETSPALVLAVGLTLSSTVVVVKLLVERRNSTSVAGQTAIGILLVQDLFVIVLLTVVAGLGTSDDPGRSPSVVGGIARALGMMATALATIVLASKFLLPPVFNWARRNRETVFIASLAWCFTVVAAVHALHLSPEIGAFLAGVSLAQLPHAHDLQRRITPLMNGFVAVFFVSLGIGMTFGTGIAFWLKAVALAGFVIVGKFTIIMAITHRLGYTRRQAFDSSLLLTQISEFSFIFAATATAAGLAGPEVGALLAVVGLLTIPVSAISVRFSDQLFANVQHRRFLRMFGSPGAAPPQEPRAPILGGHVVIVGMNTLGRKLALALHENGTTVLAVDTDPRKLTDLPCLTVEGDAASPAVLDETALHASKLLVSTLHITETNEFLAYRARHAGIPSAIHAPDLRDVTTLLDLEVAYLMTPKSDSLREQRTALANLGYLEKPTT